MRRTYGFFPFRSLRFLFFFFPLFSSFPLCFPSFFVSLSLSLSFLSALLFPALSAFPFLFPFFLSFFFPLFSSFPLCSPSFFRFSFLSFCPSFFRSFPLSHFALPLFFVSLSFLSALLFPALSAFPFLFPFFLSFFFPLFSSFPLCSPSFFRFSFLSFCPSFFRSFPLSRFAFPLSLLSALLFSALFLFPTLFSLFFSFLFPFFLSFFFPSFPSFPLCSLRIKFLCHCKKYGPAAVLMNTQYGTRKYHRPEILQKGVLGRK